MSFDSDADASINGQRLSVQLTVNNRELMANEAGFITSVIHRKMMGMVTAKLADAVDKKVGKYSTDYTLELFLLTPEQLERCVQIRAERLSYGQFSPVSRVS